jgi:hypothetical protein
LGFRVYDSASRVQVFRFEIPGSGFRVESLGLETGYRVKGQVIRVSGFRVQREKRGVYG